MNIFADFNERIIKAVEALDLKGKDGGALDLSRIAVEPPRDATPWRSGDQRRDGAGQAGRPEPARAGRDDRRGTARRRRRRRASRSPVPASSICKLADGYWQAHLAAMLDAGTDYGRSTIGDGRKVNVEYVSANPTGPMHVGHCRGAVVGDALANLLAFAGYDVTKEYYINDAGAQIDVLAPLGDAALPRGAGRRDRRDPGRPLSRRLSRPGRPGAGRGVRPRACCRCRRTRRWRSSRTAPSTP